MSVSSNPKRDGLFPSTHWSMVVDAGNDLEEIRGKALRRFLTRYMEPLKAHLVYHKRLDPDCADDLLQGFLLSRVLEAELIRRADRDRGRFRTFVLTALDHYIANAGREERRLKRGGGKNNADLEDVAEPVSNSPSPAVAFEVAWAQQVLREIVRRMRDHWEKTGRTDLWRIFDTRVLKPTLGQGEAVEYEELVAELKLDSVEQAANLLATAKRTFGRVMRSVIAEYEEGEAEIEAEIVDLRAILSGARR